MLDLVAVHWDAGWTDPHLKQECLKIASPAELSGMKPPTQSLGKRLKGTLVGPTGSKIIVRVWPRGGKGAM